MQASEVSCAGIKHNPIRVPNLLLHPANPTRTTSPVCLLTARKNPCSIYFPQPVSYHPGLSGLPFPQKNCSCCSSHGFFPLHPRAPLSVAQVPLPVSPLLSTYKRIFHTPKTTHLLNAYKECTGIECRAGRRKENDDFSCGASSGFLDRPLWQANSDGRNGRQLRSLIEKPIEGPKVAYRGPNWDPWTDVEKR